jgi:hypothetical protein
MRVLQSAAIAFTLLVFGTNGVQAGFVIDDFSVVGSVAGGGNVSLGNGVSRAIQRIGDSTVVGGAAGGSYSVTSLQPAANVSNGFELRYFFNTSVLSAFAKGSELTLASFTNNGPSAVEVRAIKNPGSEQSFIVAPGDSLVPVDFSFFDNTSWGSQFRIRFVTVDPGFAVDMSGFGPLAISAVPEPGSMALLGVATAGGMIVNRRRRRKACIV